MCSFNMANLNKVFLIGNLTRDPELRYVPSGTAVATFTVAMNRAYTLPTGEKKQEASFIRVVVWGRRAEVCGEYLNKGSLVFVEGRLQTRSWEGQDGGRRSSVEVVADNVQFLGRTTQKAPGEAPPEAAETKQEDILPADFIPEEGQAQTEGHEKDNAKQKDDEVPF